MNEETSAANRNRSQAVSSFSIPPSSFEICQARRAGIFVDREIAERTKLRSGVVQLSPRLVNVIKREKTL
jgi:hypothetical protein